MSRRVIAEKRDTTAGREETGQQEVQLACFRVGGEMYALDIMNIKEIIRPQKLTPIPKAPPFVEGVINLRGAVLPVVDLRKRFDQAVQMSDRKARVIICALAGMIIGLLVDEVAEVRRYTRQEVQPAPHYLKGKGAEFFLGVCRREDDLVMLLDLGKILTSGEKIELEKIQENTPATQPSSPS